MINGEEQLSDIIWDKLHGITVNTAPTGSPEVLAPVFMAINIPEEEAVKSSNVPGIAIRYLNNIKSPTGPRDSRDMVVPVIDPDTSDLLGYQRYDNIYLRRYYYQIDIYTYESKQLIYLAQRVFARLRVQHAALKDADGQWIYYGLEAEEDYGRDIEEERLFRRSLVYYFDAWTILDDDRENPESIGMVEYIKIEHRDKQSEEVLDTEWVPEEPPA